MKRGLLLILSVLCLAELTACNVMRPISVTPEKTYTISRRRKSESLCFWAGINY